MCRIRKASARPRRNSSDAADHLDVLVNNAGILLDEDKAILTMTPEIFETTMRTNTLGPLLVAAAFEPLLDEIFRSAHHQCLEWRRPTGRRRRWMGTRLLYFQNGTEWRDRPACRGVAEIRGEFRLSWLGANRHGRSGCDSFGRTRRGYDCLARDAMRRKISTGKFLRDRKEIPW